MLLKEKDKNKDETQKTINIQAIVINVVNYIIIIKLQNQSVH